MTDRELLEWAAKACGYTIHENGKDINGDTWYWCEQISDCWSPLTDDGDALRLAVKLGISITPYPIYNSENRHSVIAKQRRKSDTLRENNPTEVIEIYGSDEYAATRRAIVRAAASIGEQIHQGDTK